MKNIISELNDDLEARSSFYWSIFEKMHLDLPDIKAKNFGTAEQNLELIKFLLDFDGAAEAFVTGQHFFGTPRWICFLKPSPVFVSTCFPFCI